MTTVAPAAPSAVRDRRTDPLRAAGDDRDLAVQRSLQGREGRRDEDPVVLRVDERLDLREELHPARIGLQARAALLPLGVRVVAPERRVRRERADVGREGADEAAEVLLLDRDPLGRRTAARARRACPSSRGSRAARGSRAQPYALRGLPICDKNLTR